MTRRKGFSGNQYKEEIINILKNQPFMSTNEFCTSLNMGYDTAYKYLNELHKNKKINLKRIGNRRFWYV
ncbi:MAG: hypothetical protein V1870_01455 [Candidatus Aenigmatarchaeota archaeon]